MKRVSLDYAATEEGICKICGRKIYPGMYVFDVKLRGNKLAVAHSLCEQKLQVRK